jgi:hypothetical protein
MNSTDDEARIRERAYKIWMEEGQPEGREQEHWERAVREIDRELSESRREESSNVR